MRILKHRTFNQWAISEKVSDKALVKAIEELEQGLFDANLGGGLYKKRVARKGQGKSKGYRTLVAFKAENISIFVYGFAKNEKSNISKQDQAIYKKLAKQYLGLTKKELGILLGENKLIEVTP